MRTIDLIRQTETDHICNFFQLDTFTTPPLPDWIDEERVRFWNELLFDIHFLPKHSLEVSNHFFCKAIQQGTLPPESNRLPGKWILIDTRDKPEKTRPWISASDVRMLEKLGFQAKNFLKKKSSQSFHQEYLGEILKQHSFGSRFCLSVNDINELKPQILEILKCHESKKIRLPSFIEYFYLGKTFYPQWGTTKTWEWFEDIYDHTQHLAGGSGSLDAIGCDPIEYWSTILTFRPLIEL